MKKMSLLAAAFITSLVCTAWATSVTYSGKVNMLNMDDGTSSGPGGTTYTGQVFSLDTSASNTCKSLPVRGGTTLVRIPDNAAGDRMRAVVMAAYLAGKTVTVTVNDATGSTNKDALGVCYAKGVQVSPY